MTDTTAVNDTNRKYTVTTDVSRKSVENVTGDKTHVNETTKTTRELTGDFDNRVIELIDGELKERKAEEDKRADARNRNRILSLIVVLAFELLVPMLYGYGILPSFFMKYEVLAITAPDALLTMYAYFRKY
jgi:hypothetical protein